MASHGLHKIWLLILLNMVLISSFTHAAGNSNLCSFPKCTFSLKIGEKGVLECICDQSTSLYWYVGNDTTTVQPFIFIDYSVKYGPGYLSGEYDINSNGSLVIANVSSTHRGEYSVVIIEPGNPQPIVKHFTVDVCCETEATDTMEKSKHSEREVVDDVQDATESATKREVHNGSQEPYLKKVDFKSLQHGTDQLKILDSVTLALLIILLVIIVLVSMKHVTCKLTKNSNADQKGTPREVKCMLSICAGNCPHGDGDKATDT